MVDQAQVTAEDRSTELPPRAVARGTAEFLHDVLTLAELQGKLALVDFQEGTAKILITVVALVIGVAWGMGCFPIALVALAVALKESTTLSLSASFGIALLVGLGLSALLAIPALLALKAELRMFDRSMTEWRRNLQWFKDTLKRLPQTTSASHWPPSPASRF
jgi:hypothetical protein